MTLAEACGKTRWQVHVYCLMSNHFHVVMETPEPNLVTTRKSAIIQEAGEAPAERLIFTGLQALKWGPAVLPTCPKSDESKFTMALEIQRANTMTLP